MLRWFWVFIVLGYLPVAAEETPSPEQLEFFEKRVRPVLIEHCQKCHGADQQKGGLRLDSRAGMLRGGDSGAAIVPGQSAESPLVEAIGYDPDGYQMPPKGKLPAEVIADLTKWVELGAPWPAERAVADPVGGSINIAERAQHWSFQPIQHPVPPEVHQSDWCRGPIDRFVLAKLETVGLQPAGEAGRRALFRRVTLELTGLPPSPEELESFLADQRPDAYEQLVDRLLDSPRYGERWGRHWLDLVRFAETGGHEFDYEIPNAAPYRDYVVRAWNADLPYDQFVIEHVAGDLLPAPRRELRTGLNESVTATAFYWFPQSKHSPVDLRAEQCDTVDNQIDVFGKTFLGLTIACARCHDHKFDPITARDYYALAGYLKSSRLNQADRNPPVLTNGITDRLQEDAAVLTPALVTQSTARLRKLLESWPQLAGKWQDAAKDPGHPLFAPVALALGKTDDEFQQRRASVRQALQQRRNAVEAACAASEILPPVSGWLPTGFAFQGGRTVGGEPILQPDPQQPVRQLALPGEMHSGRISGRLRGDLRSPSFTIRHKFIDYLMVRRPGNGAPQRRHKSGQVHLIVDGFHIIQNPLYGGLTINVPTGDRPVWVRMDVSKLIGASAYIEAEDLDDGWLILQQVQTTDGPAPALSPNSLVSALVDDASISFSGEWLQRFQQLVERELTAWEQGSLSREPDAADRIELINSLLLCASDAPETAGPESAPLTAWARTRREQEAAIPLPAPTIAMTDGFADNEHVLIRGNPKKPGDEVPRRFLEVFAGPDRKTESPGSGRLELARQLVDGSNPLATRVIVNRLWLHHFGRGLVPTPDDFGKMGQPPSHPELLDWLATELVRGGWSLKRLQRQIVLSAAYRMTSHPSDAKTEDANPQNVLLHRQNLQRLEAEAIRDSLLVLSGRLDDRMEGPSVAPHLTPFMEGRGRPGQSGPLDGDGRRSLYINVRRNFLTPMFLAFDFPTPFTTMGKRSSSNVPAQALTMMNNPFVVQQTAAWAQHELAIARTDAEHVDHLYEAAYGRSPTATERSRSLAFVDQQAGEYGGDRAKAWADLCHVLVNVKEFLFVE